MKLQNYSDGQINRLNNGTYEVVTSQGTATGKTVNEALRELSDAINDKFVAHKEATKQAETPVVTKPKAKRKK